MDNVFKKKLLKQSYDAGLFTASTTDDKLSQLAFNNAAQANIITIVSNGRIIMANNAASKLLGYSKKGLLTKSRSAIFNINESSFKKMLKQRTAEGQSIATLTAIKKNGKVFTCEITSAVFVGGRGVKKAITTITDMSQHILKQKKIDTDKERIVAENIVLAQVKSDYRLAANNEWIKSISKTSYDVMWDWDITSGKIYVGDSIKEVFGYEVKNNTVHFKDFAGKLLLKEKNAVEKRLFKVLASESKHWNDAFLFKCHDGAFVSTTSRASIVRDDAGKAIRLIGAIQDISRLLELEKKLEEQVIIHKDDSERFLLAAKLSFDVIWDWNLLTNEVFLGDGFEELFGYTIKDNKGDMITDWVNYLHPDDVEAVVKELQDCIKSTATGWEHAYRVSRKDGSVAKVFVRASIIRHADGKAYRMIGAIQDLSRQKELEEKLEQEILLKEKQIEDAAEDARETERSDIGKELHDNINQLLGASRMYLEMAKRGGENSALYLSRSSEYTLNAIDEIRNLTKGLTTDIINNIGLGDAIENTVRDLSEVNLVKISSSLESFNEDSVTDKFKHNVFRIIQEQLNNILKHAKAEKIIISLVQNKRSIKLRISDNGIGYDTRKKQKGIGIENIKDRASRYKGNAVFVSQPGRGCVLTVLFPVSGLLLKIS
ncbi:MAG: PAS domain-containing protein [Chitinophagaceae bacterium]|nr:PAS domain-containing protein [Chitinophagaceae bacterium]